MRRILLTMMIALFALTLAGAAFAQEKTVEKSIALAMTFTGDETAIGDYIHAAMFVNSLRALGGEIELDGDRLILRLELGPEQLEALRKALSEEHPGIIQLSGPTFDKDYSIQTRMREPGSHERFLLGKKHKTPCKGCKPSPESMEKEVKIIMRGDMREGKPFAMKEGCCKLTVTCPKCGEKFEIDVPMPEMGVPMPEMRPGEHPEMFMFRMHPDGEFAPPHPPMPDAGMMMERVGPMMERMPEMMERMERFHRECGDMERRLGEMERALEEFHRYLGPRTEERDHEFWRAIEEMHRALEDRNREIFTALEELEYERDEEFGDLWRALDELYEVLEQLERELE